MMQDRRLFLHAVEPALMGRSVVPHTRTGNSEVSGRHTLKAWGNTGRSRFQRVSFTSKVAYGHSITSEDVR